MCDKPVDALLPALKFNSDYFVANKMLMDHNTINVNNINFDDNSSDEVDSEISNKLLPAMWHPTRWLDWWISERKKKGDRTIFDWWKVV